MPRTQRVKAREGWRKVAANRCGIRCSEALSRAGRSQAAEALGRLRGDGRHRARLGALRRLAPHGPGSAPVPMLAQLAARVAERAPAPDLVHNTASLRCAPGRIHSSPLPCPVCRWVLAGWQCAAGLRQTLLRRTLMRT